MRDKIIVCAQDKFFKFGYSKVRVDEIAEDLGISKKTVYNHFRGKEDILLNLIDKMKVDFEADIIQIEQNNADDYRELIHQVLKALGVWVSRISLFTQDLKKHSTIAHQRLMLYKKDVAIYHSTKILNQGVAQGYLESSSNTQIALFMFLTAADRLIDEDYHKHLPGEMLSAFPKDQAEGFRAIVDILYKGLKST